MKTPKTIMTFFNRCDNLTKPRNNIAHRLEAVSREKFERVIGMKGNTFEKKVDSFVKLTEQAIKAIYPACDKEVFGLHERAFAYIVDNR